MQIKNYLKNNYVTLKTVELTLITLSKVLPFVKLLFPSNSQYEKGSIRRVKRNGVKYELDISDYQDYLLYFNIQSKSAAMILKKLDEKEGLVLDIGANIGQDSLLMAKKLKDSKSRIIAFEPYSSNFGKMKKNMELNNCQNIQLEKIALGNMDSSLAMVKDNFDNNAGLSAYVYEKHYSKNKIMVKQRSLDSYLAKLDEKVSFIKIDVDGYECQVLLGGEKTLQKDRPKLFIILNEEKLRAQGYSVQELMDFLRKMGYSSIKNAKTAAQIDPVNMEQPHTFLFCKN